jgi:hypothetical protein
MMGSYIYWHTTSQDANDTLYREHLFMVALAIVVKSHLKTVCLNNIHLNICVRSLSVSFFIEKEPHKQLRMKRKRKGER